MDVIQYVIGIIKRNLFLFILIIGISIAGGFIHCKIQKVRYVSQFTTTKGGMEYTLFVDLVHFGIYDSVMYDLPVEKLKSIDQLLSPFTISYIEGSANSVNFSLVTTKEDVDHIVAQHAVIELLNSNRYIKNALLDEKHMLKSRAAFLDDKLTILDSSLTRPYENSESIGENALDAYTLYEFKTEIDLKNKMLGNFELIKPVRDTLPNSKPLTVFIALYGALGLLIFFFLAKKTPYRKEE